MHIPLFWFLKIILHQKQQGLTEETADFKAGAEKVQEDELRTSRHTRK